MAWMMRRKVVARNMGVQHRMHQRSPVVQEEKPPKSPTTLNQDWRSIHQGKLPRISYKSPLLVHKACCTAPWSHFSFQQDIQMAMTLSLLHEATVHCVGVYTR